MKKKILIIFGTRPEAIKMAPVVNMFKKEKCFITKVVVTAQHREMLDQVLKLFNINPSYDLNIMKERQSLTSITCKGIRGLTKIIGDEKPDIVFVHGDTTTTFTGALSAFYNKIAVAHVEAGLRTNDKYNPYPEEINRRLTASITDINFAPTKVAKENLLKEGIPENKIFVTGNTVIDALKYTIRKRCNINYIKHKKKIIIVTAHRRENWGKPLENICEAIKEIKEKYKNIEIYFPVHMNPIVQNIVNYKLKNIEGIYLMQPLEYLPFVHLLNKSYIVLTDSGGMQEEAPALGKPVLVLRHVTERPEAVAAGTVKVIGTEKESIISEVSLLLDDNNEYEKMSKAINPYGDGFASKRIVDYMKYYFFNREKPKEFSL